MKMNTRLEDIDILTLLPQRPPFVMVDALTSFDEMVTTTVTTVRKDHLFIEDDGRLNPCALVEIVAQTCAARMGYINQYIYKERVRLGYIGSIRNLQIFSQVYAGDTLTTTIEVVQEVMQLTLVNATVRRGIETIVTAEMKIAMSNIEVKAS